MKAEDAEAFREALAVRMQLQQLEALRKWGLRLIEERAALLEALKDLEDDITSCSCDECVQECSKRAIAAIAKAEAE